MKIHKTNTMRLLDEKKLDYEVLSYESKKGDDVDGIHVAQKLNEPVEKVFKTLVGQANTKEYFVFMVPVDKKLDLKKCAKAAGVKNFAMLPLKDLTKITGYIRGGCSPLAMKKSFRTFMDESALQQKDIYFSAGKIGLQIHMDPAIFIENFEIQPAAVAA